MKERRLTTLLNIVQQIAVYYGRPSTYPCLLHISHNVKTTIALDAITTTIDLMKVHHSNINAFLFTPNKYFEIPDFQRPYSWNITQIKTYMEDLEKLLKSGNSHYFGSIVYISSGQESTIIDGQQRATTVLLMITALYHLIGDNPAKSKREADWVNESFLYNRFGDENNRIKLRAMTTDDAIFKKIYSQLIQTAADKESKLYKAYKYFYEYFKDKENLDLYVDALERFEIVDISLESSDDNPQKIFESINSTGKALSDGDKIRNFALMLNNKQSRKLVLEKYWKIIERELEDQNKDLITDFFKHFLTSYAQKEIKVDQVYPYFKDISDERLGDDQSDIERIEAFYGEILDNLYHYLFLKFNKDPLGRYAAVEDIGFRLNYLKIEITFPFLFRVLDLYTKDKMAEEEIVSVFKTTEGYLARRVICNIPTTSLNRMYGSLHQDIVKRGEDSEHAYSDIYSSILMEKVRSFRFPRVTEIRATGLSAPFYSYRRHYQTYILSSVDDFEQSKESRLLRDFGSGGSELSIEHIMPQALTKQWREDLGAEYERIHDTYLHTLPNLTLTGYNLKYSNSNFSRKKSMENGFDQSPLIINQFVKTKDVWNEAALLERSAWWEQMIAKIWPEPDAVVAPSTSENSISLLDDHDLKGSTPVSVTVLGDLTHTSNWTSALETILEALYEKDPLFIEKVMRDEDISKWITADAAEFRNPLEIAETGYFIETNSTSNTKQWLINRLAELFDLGKEDLQAEVVGLEANIQK